MDNIIFTLADFNSDLIKEWMKTPYDFYEGNFFDLEADVLLIPGNSFGIMQEGIEQVALYHFGKRIERDIQSQIKNTNQKELLVGSSVLVESGKTNIPNIIYSPVYRVPQVIADPMSVYLAFKSAIDIANCQGYRNIVFPGFGTGAQTGNLKEDWAVRLMNFAIEDVFNPKEFPRTIQDAREWHYQAYPK